MSWQKLLFIAACLFCLSPYGSPPAALALGLVFAFTIGSPYPLLSGRPTNYLLQASVVLLGFGMNLQAVYQAGKQGIAFTVATIFGTLLLGYFVGRLLIVKPKTSALISSGTAICGGSAIAAVGPAIDADPGEMSVALGTVFVLNAVALFLFPLIGNAAGMTQGQFGVWAAIAIHDTSSVVGASGTYGADALAIATTVKLVRALWIVPVALLFAFLYRKGERTSERKGLNVPWFIFLFVVAAAARTYLSPVIFPSLFDAFVNLGKAGMVITLFLIGASLSRKMLRDVGVRPLIQGVILWIVISITSLWAVLYLL
jgi:uncharacterized integral membrane protein (TIGR00698 family)